MVFYSVFCFHFWQGSPEVQSDDIKPEELIFKIDDEISQAKEHAAETYKKNVSKIVADWNSGYLHIYVPNQETVSVQLLCNL